MHLESVRIRSDLFPDRGTYPFNLPHFGSVETISFPSCASFFVGENGSGKSTLIEAIAGCTGIHIWKGFPRSRYRKNPYEQTLHRFLTPVWSDGKVPGAFFASELFKSFSELLDEWATTDPGILEYFGQQSLMTLSHGQSHMRFFESRFSRPGLYLLDEPETALSPRTQIELLGLLEDVARSGDAQFIIATHSPILLSLSGAVIYDFDSPDLAEVTYTDTTHYTTYLEFFRARGELS